jgi:catechol 2,3-dioxygenase-like lactoylglutathione lyase family enzyme
MIDHFGLPAADPAAVAEFYTTVFAPLGLSEAMRFDTPDGPVIGLADRSGQPYLWFNPAGPDVGVTGPGGFEAHIALHAGSRAEVDAVADAARAAGAEILHEPREWPEYHPGYYAVFVRDPAGNNAEAVTHA